MTNSVNAIVATATTTPVAEYSELFAAIKKMVTSDKSNEQTATDMGRHAYAALLGGLKADGTSTFTVDTLKANLLAAYKGQLETLPSGKLSAVLPNLPKQRHDSIVFVMKNLGIEGVRPLVETFIAATDKASTFNGLTKAVKAAVKADAKAKADASGEGEGGEGGEGEGEGGDSQGMNVSGPSIGKQLADVATLIAAMTAADLVTYDAALAAVAKAMTAAYAAATAADVAIAA